MLFGSYVHEKFIHLRDGNSSGHVRALRICIDNFINWDTTLPCRSIGFARKLRILQSRCILRENLSVIDRQIFSFIVVRIWTIYYFIIFWSNPRQLPDIKWTQNGLKRISEKPRLRTVRILVIIGMLKGRLLISLDLFELKTHRNARRRVHLATFHSH